jgi:hypothetical protein
VWKVWGRVSSNKTPLSKEEKELKQAEFTVKLMPYLLPLVLALSAYFLVGLIKHPGPESLLRLLGPLAFALMCLMQWRMAQARLRCLSVSWERACELLSMFLMLMGPNLAGLYHRHGLGGCLVLGIPVLILSAGMLAMAAWEVIDARRKQRNHNLTVDR